MDGDVTVSSATARFFYDQICEMYNGHMAMIPFNPELHSLVKSHEVHDERDFARFLRQVADRIEEEPKF